MTQVFISYSRKDLAFVEKLAKDLRASGFEVWYDLSNLEVGKNWGKEIQAAIHKSKYLVVVLSPNSIDSEWVEREYLFANNLKLKIIPFVYKACELPLWSLNIHYIDMASSNYRRSYEELLKVLGPPERPEPLPAPKVETPLVQPEAVTPVQPGEPKLQLVTEPVPTVKEIVKAAQPVARKGARKPLVVAAGILVVVGLIAAGIFGLGRGDRSTLFSTGFLAKATPTPTKTPPTLTPTITSTSSPTFTPLPAGTSMVSAKDGMELLYVPPGVFEMGDLDSANAHLYNVTLDGFWIDKTEVTNAMYQECVEAGVCIRPLQADSSTRAEYFGVEEFKYYPVIHVTWQMAKTYCEWVGRRLPTEAEWEKAARGTAYYTYPWGHDTENYEMNLLNARNFRGIRAMVGDTTKVGSFPDGKSPYGALDMAGNVMEWVVDWFQPGYLDLLTLPIINPTSPANGDKKILRGGSWDSPVTETKTYDRVMQLPTFTSNEIGFRCAFSEGDL